MSFFFNKSWKLQRNHSARKWMREKDCDISYTQIHYDDMCFYVWPLTLQAAEPWWQMSQHFNIAYTNRTLLSSKTFPLCPHFFLWFSKWFAFVDYTRSFWFLLLLASARLYLAIQSFWDWFFFFWFCFFSWFSAQYFFIHLFGNIVLRRPFSHFNLWAPIFKSLHLVGWCFIIPIYFCELFVLVLLHVHHLTRHHQNHRFKTVSKQF